MLDTDHQYSSSVSLSWQPSDKHPLDATLAAEFRRLNGVLGSTFMTELALHPTVAIFIHSINIIPANVDRVNEAAKLATT